MDKTKIRDIMTKSDKLISVKSNDTVAQAARLMIDNEVGSILVFEDENLVGIITKRDILARNTVPCIDPCITKVHDIASKNLITISPEKPIKEALMIMYKHRIRRIPVIEPERNELVGIITTHDLIAAYNSLEMPSNSTSKSILDIS